MLGGSFVFITSITIYNILLSLLTGCSISVSCIVIKFFETAVNKTKYVYNAFGMLIPNRHGSSDGYRYGFQGQEKDDEIKGEGNSINYKYRMHDPRVGRFFAVDPLFREYAHYSPYSFSGNKVIAYRELEGAEEYESYTAYKMHTGEAALTLENLDGKNGIWFTNDRVEKTHRWQEAMTFITKNEANNMFKSYSQQAARDAVWVQEDKYSFNIVRDYYHWAQGQVEDRGFASRWAKGASYLVDELADTFQEGATSGSLVPAFGTMMRELNLEIAGFAVKQYNNILFGGEEVTDWYNWDSDFVTNEQRNIAFDVYSRYDGTLSLKAANILARKTLGDPSALGGHFFPDFSKFDTDLTDSKSRYGENGRYNIPMHMLYPARHQQETGEPLTKEQQTEINRANEEVKQFNKENN